MTPDEIFEALATAGRGRFPRQTLNEAVEQREAMTPLLLAELRHQVDAAFAPALETEGYWRHLFAIYLLAYFREPAAYPLLVKMGTLPEDTLEEAIGDSLTEDFGSQLAAVCHGDTSGIERLIEDCGLSPSIRTASLHALEILFAVGELDRDGLEERLGRFASQWLAEAEAGQPVPEDSDWVWATLVWIAADIDAQGLVPTIRRAFELDLVDPMLGGDAARFEQTIAEHRKHRKRYTPLPGVRLPGHPVEEMERWYCFRPLEPKAGRVPDGKPAPVRRGGAKVGRNDPCPCGSGKKYKKCCGA